MASRLTALDVKEKAKPGRYGDGGGLYLLISPGGSKSWVQRVSLDGKRTDKGLGGWPTLSLAKARKIADANRVAIRRGINPFEKETRPTITAQAAPEGIPSFREAARKKYNLKAEGLAESTAIRWLRRLEIHLYASLGDTPVDEITRADLADALAPIKRRNLETFRKVKQAATEVFTWATAMNYIAHSPADAALDELLPKVTPQVKHREALHHSKVEAAILKIRDSEGKRVARLAYEFLILTAARSSEVRFATWGEIDREAGTWTIPASRMKARHAHVVPLSEQAKAILGEAMSFYRDEWAGIQIQPDSLIFPHPTTMQRLSENIFVDRARKSQLGCDTHGFRSSFEDWAIEQSGARFEAIELSLAHRVGTGVTEAYFRSDLVEQRRELMQAWADYVAPTESPF